MKSSAMRASSVYFYAVAAVLVDLSTAEWNSQQREGGE
jgi:hypothetical protein